MPTFFFLPCTCLYKENEINRGKTPDKTEKMGTIEGHRDTWMRDYTCMHAYVYRCKCMGCLHGQVTTRLAVSKRLANIKKMRRHRPTYEQLLRQVCLHMHGRPRPNPFLHTSLFNATIVSPMPIANALRLAR